MECMIDSLRHSGENYALPKVWTVSVSDNVISTSVSDIFLNDCIVAFFLFVHDFCLKATFFETCWASNPKCNHEANYFNPDFTFKH